MRKIPVYPTSRQKIWAYVRNIRCKLGIERALYFDIIHFVEIIMPNIFPEFILEICPTDELYPLHGETIPSENKIRIREDVYIGACNGKGRDRLTIAHEIGHFLMHDEKSISFCKIDSDGNIPVYRDPDWQADVFAGELLAPAYLIEGMSVADVSTSCFDICPYCGWEDDGLFEDNPNIPGGANETSLNKYRKAYNEKIKLDPNYRWDKDNNKH